MENAPVSKMLHFSSYTRLRCPHCGTISNNHKAHSPRYERYWYETAHPQLVFLHTCHRCGYTDDIGDGFMDSGNDEREEFKNLYDREAEINKEQDELDYKRAKLKQDLALFERCWQSDEDYHG